MNGTGVVYSTYTVQQQLPPSPPPEADLKLASGSSQAGQRSLGPGATPRVGYAATSSNVYQPYTAPNMSSNIYGPERSRSPHLAAVGHSHEHHDQTLSAILFRLLNKSRELLPFISSASLSLPSHAESSSTSTAQPNLASSMKSMVPSATALSYAGLCSLWYMSSALSNNTGKSILAAFRYPVTLTLVQFGFVAGYCVLFCAAREQLAVSRAKARGGPGGLHNRKNSVFLMNGRLSGLTVDWGLALASWGIRKPSKTALHGTLVMSLFQIAGHVFSSMAIARVPVSTVHTIKVSRLPFSFAQSS